jgi:chloride channel protein, CIC family
MKINILKLWDRLLQSLPDNSKEVVFTVCLALLSAASSVCFMLLVNLLFSNTFIRYSHHSKLFFAVASLITILTSSIVVGILLNHFSPDSAGSGIPELKAAYWKEMGYVKAKNILIKFIAGILSIGGGTSLGREGPTIYISGGIASTLSGYLGSPKRMRRRAAAIGAAAGLAAAFNAPLAAITFVLEEIIGDMNSRHLGRVVLASLTGAFVVYAIIGKNPTFVLPAIDYLAWQNNLVVPFVAFAGSLAGIAYQKGTLALRGRIKQDNAIPAWLRPCIGGFITWVIGVSVFVTTGMIGIFGLGYEDLSSTLLGKTVWWVAGILVIAKLLATIASYGFGGCGGIFSPLLFIGGMIGYFIAGLLNLRVPLNQSDITLLCAVGMSASLGAVVRAPLTTILIVFEMTHEFSLLPGLMISLIITTALSKMVGNNNFYDSLLIQDGNDLIKIRPPQDIRGWKELPVSAIANNKPIVLSDLSVDNLKKVVEKYPYNNFPVIKDGKPIGIISREKIMATITYNTTPIVQEVQKCFAFQNIMELDDLFIESERYMVLITDPQSGDLQGILTIHDLLRAQASIYD